MADTKISGLTAGAPAVRADVVPISRTAGSATRSLTVGNIVDVDRPIVVGGTTTTSTLTLKPTTAAGITGADIIFQVGNNGATEAMRVVNAGRVVIGDTVTGTAALFEISRDDATTTAAGGSMNAFINRNTTDGDRSMVAFATVDTGAATQTSSRIAGVHTSHTAGAVTGTLEFQTRTAGTIGVVATLGTGLQLGAPTGGDKGAGTLNPAAAYYSNGTLGVGTVGSGTAITCPITAFTTAGGLVTVVTGTSDERLKQWSAYDRGLDALRDIVPIRFRWNDLAQAHGMDGHTEQFGFRAQNVQQTLPETIGQETWADGQVWLTANYYAILCAAVNAIKTLDARLTQLERGT